MHLHTRNSKENKLQARDLGIIFQVSRLLLEFLPDNPQSSKRIGLERRINELCWFSNKSMCTYMREVASDRIGNRM